MTLAYEIGTPRLRYGLSPSARHREAEALCWSVPTPDIDLHLLFFPLFQCPQGAVSGTKRPLRLLPAS